MTYKIYDAHLKPHEVTTLEQAYVLCATFARWEKVHHEQIDSASSPDAKIFAEIEFIRQHLNLNLEEIEKMRADPDITLPETKEAYRKVATDIRQTAEKFSLDEESP